MRTPHKNNRLVETKRIFNQVAFSVPSVAEPHHFYEALTPGKTFDAAPAAPAPTLRIARQKNFLTN
jgi:hypothetical protein